MATKRLGEISGYDVNQTPSTYSFGCGAVAFPHSVVHNFLNEAERRQKEGLTQQETDYNRVMGVVNERGIRVNLPNLRKIFGTEVPKAAKPAKKVVKKAAKKPAKKVSKKTARRRVIA